MRKSPEVLVSMGKRDLGVFIPLTVLFMITSSRLILDPDSSIGAAVIGLIITGLCARKILHGLRRIKVGNLYRKYIHRLSVSSDNKIHNLVSAFQTSENTVRRNLKSMAKEGLFKSFIIDEEGVIHIEGGPEDLFVLKSVEKKLGEMVSLKCHACGAPMSIVKGTGAKCEYCGTLVTSKEE